MSVSGLSIRSDPGGHGHWRLRRDRGPHPSKSQRVIASQLRQGGRLSFHFFTFREVAVLLCCVSRTYSLVSPESCDCSLSSALRVMSHGDSLEKHVSFVTLFVSSSFHLLPHTHSGHHQCLDASARTLARVHIVQCSFACAPRMLSYT